MKHSFYNESMRHFPSILRASPFSAPTSKAPELSPVSLPAASIRSELFLRLNLRINARGALSRLRSIPEVERRGSIPVRPAPTRHIGVMNCRYSLRIQTYPLPLNRSIQFIPVRAYGKLPRTVFVPSMSWSASRSGKPCCVFLQGSIPRIEYVQAVPQAPPCYTDDMNRRYIFILSREIIDIC